MKLRIIAKKVRILFSLFLFFSVVVATAQTPKMITGTVLSSEDNSPLPGASVVVKGTTIGTSTDFDGKFSIEAPADATTLVVSYIGFQSQEVAITDAPLSIVLQVGATLDEVVVTALGVTRSEKALGYAVQKVEGKSLQTVRGVDIGTSLTGKVAGLNVLNSTEFGAAPEILIRGENPLIVIDGMPYQNMTLRDVPADDIESMSILKGATASALYGARGQGGAIMITTKKSGNKGLTVSVNSGSMFTAGYLAIPETQSTFGRTVSTATNIYDRNANGSWGVPMDGREVIQWDPITKSLVPMPYLPRGKDNFSNFLEQGYILNNNISILQQGETGSFRVSATRVDNKGQYPNSHFSKNTFSLGGEMKMNKFSLSSTMSYTKQSSPNLGFNGYRAYDPMYSMLIWGTPDWDVRDYTDYWVEPNLVQNTSYTGGVNNPYFDRNERTRKINKDILNGMLSLNYEINSWLKLSNRTGFDTYSNKQEVTISMGSFQGAGTAKVLDGATEIWGESKKGSYNQGIGRGYSLNDDLLLLFNKTIKDLTIDGLVGGSMTYNQDEGIEALTKGGLSIPGFYSLNASVLPIYVKSRLYRKQVNSIYGRAGISYKGIFYAETTLRNDWTSTLAKENRSYLYPSFSGSFVASELLPKTDWLSFWKIRASQTTAKKPADIYDINMVYGITQNAWGTLTSASYPGTIRGTDLRAESSSTFEVGTALSVYNNRASLDVSYYSKRMFDFLKSASVSPSSGYYSNYVNTNEEITRRGIEISANVTPVLTSDVRWDISLNWSKYARYYTKLDSVFSADKPWVKVGERYDAYIINDYLKDPDGNIIHSNGLPLYSSYGTKFGNYDPDWIWGLNSNLKYKNWSLSVSFDGRVGGLAQTGTEMYMWISGNHPESVVPERYLDAATPGSSNYIGEGVKVTSGTVSFDTYGNILEDTRVYAPNDVAVTYKTYISKYHKGTAWGGSPSPVDTYSTTFFKMRELSITYNVPKSFSDKLNAKNISISAIGQNLLFWAKDFKYSDPDGGTDDFSDPSQRYIGFNVKLDF